MKKFFPLRQPANKDQSSGPIEYLRWVKSSGPIEYLRWVKSSGKNDQTGFSLIELLIVLSLITIIALLTTASTGFLSRMVVRAELEHMYSVCYYLQQRALMLHKPQKIVFDTKKQCYTTNNATYRLPFHVRFGTASSVKGPPSSPKEYVHSPVTFTQNSITFYPDGIIQSGTVYLTDSSHQCTYALSCAVSPVSYLRKYQYTDAWQLLS